MCRRRSTLFLAVWGILCCCGSIYAATDSKTAVNRELAKPVVRGAIVFKTYCKLCHGERGDGLGRAAKIHDRKSMAIRSRSPEYYEKIIRQGGEAVGRSSFMPVWQDELSEEQITDVISYLSVIGNSTNRGETVFKANCILCHGIKGNGKGRASVLFDPPPADLTHSDKNDDYKKMIITYGGAAMGRSSVMPIWGEQLSEVEINDVVNYINTLVVVD